MVDGETACSSANLQFVDACQKEEEMDQDHSHLVVMVEEAGLNITAEATGVTLREIPCSAHAPQPAVEDSLKKWLIAAS